MNKRECSDCRENEKTFRNNFNYKCQNDYCENYIKPVCIKKVRFENEPTLNFLMIQSNKICNLYMEIIDLRQQIIKLQLENRFFKKEPL